MMVTTKKIRQLKSKGGKRKTLLNVCYDLKKKLFISLQPPCLFETQVYITIFIFQGKIFLHFNCPDVDLTAFYIFLLYAGYEIM